MKTFKQLLNKPTLKIKQLSILNMYNICKYNENNASCSVLTSPNKDETGLSALAC